MPVVNDVNRPDVNGVPPKMQAIGEQAKALLANSVPVLSINTNDNLGSSVSISGSLDPRETWVNGIYENSRHFRFSINPAKGHRYYTDGEPVCVELFQVCYKIPVKFRKYTGPVDKVLAKVQAWIESAKG